MNPTTEAIARLILDYFRVILSFPGVILIVALLFHRQLSEKIKAILKGKAAVGSSAFEIQFDELTSTGLSEAPESTTMDSEYPKLPEPVLSMIHDTMSDSIKVLELLSAYSGAKPAFDILIGADGVVENVKMRMANAGFLFSAGLVDLNFDLTPKVTNRGLQVLSQEPNQVREDMPK